MSATVVPSELTSSCTMFKRRSGTAGISGHLYETKLLSLLYFRALHYGKIIEFQIASNVDNIGTFDDICFKGKVAGSGKPLMFFIQAKHRENKKRTLKIDLSDYFTSYLKIRKQFDPNNKDLFFKGTFDETESLFVSYTTAKDDFSDDSELESSACSILNHLIGTSGTVKQPYKQKEDVKFLCKVAMKVQMTYLAERIAKFINGKAEMLLTDATVLRYHVILAQKVFDVSKVQPDRHRIASFRDDFFDNYEEYLSIFKDKLFEEILKEIKIESTDINNLLSEFLAEPTDATKLSKLIGTVMTYNDGKLEINKQYTEYFRPHLQQVYVSQLNVYQAVELAAKQILLSPEFKLRVPSGFGNKDLTLRSKQAKREKRINYITSKIINLLEECKSSKVVTIDESMGDGFLQRNGGIAGAIGNIFVLDDNTKLIKITDTPESLEPLAKKLYESLNKEIELKNSNSLNNKISKLNEYKFSIKVNNFPKLLLEYNEYEEYLARDFFKKLIFCSKQAEEKHVDKILMDEIGAILPESNYFQSKTDAMSQYVLRYHNEMQIWWMLPNKAPYLTKDSKIFEKATSYIIEDPHMSSISIPYMRKIQQYNYTFSEDALNSLNLPEQHHCAIIVAENTILTVVKLMQHFRNKDHVVLDLEHIVNLPTSECNELRRELTNINKEKVLIFVCNTKQDSRTENKTFENVADAVCNKKTIIVTNSLLVDILKSYFNSTDPIIINDERNSLIDMTEQTQKRILESTIVKFQGIEVALEHLVNGWTRVPSAT